MTASSSTGAKTALRTPTQMRASPRRSRSHSAWRSASERPEWSSATWSPKRARKRPESCGRQRDLGDQHQRPLAGGPGRGDGPQVDLGLARAGDAVEQEGGEGRRRRRSPRPAPPPGRRSARRRGPGPASTPRSVTGVSASITARPRLTSWVRAARAGREGGAQLLHGDPAAGQQVVEHGALGPGPPQRGQGLGGPRRGGGVLDAPAVRPGGAAAGVEARAAARPGAARRAGPGSRTRPSAAAPPAGA